MIMIVVRLKLAEYGLYSSGLVLVAAKHSLTAAKLDGIASSHATSKVGFLVLSVFRKCIRTEIPCETILRFSINQDLPECNRQNSL